MNLTIGLLAHDAVWEQLLAQIGVSWTVVSDPLSVSPDTCSVLIANAEPNTQMSDAIRAYLHSGGAVLGDFGRLQGVLGCRSSLKRYTFLTPQAFGRFSPSTIVDIYSNGRVLTDCNNGDTRSIVGDVHADESGGTNTAEPSQSDVVQLFSVGGGIAASIPFDISALLQSSEFRRKNFYAKTHRLPSEFVSTVSKGPVREIVTNVLEYLHHARALPFVHMWYYPGTQPSIFTFRVDTDKGSRTELSELYDVCTRHGVKGTWFADVKSHEAWLDFFASFRMQEIGLHCYEHRTDEDVEAVRANFSKGLRLLREAGLTVRGASAPCGTWNTAVDTVYRELELDYSSEFSLAYDDLPFFPILRPIMGPAGPMLPPVSGGSTSTVLQLPIHPVCVGTMRRSAFTPEQMREYFRTWIDDRIRSREPICLYHHPTHHHWDVFDDVFSYIRSRGIQCMTYSEYAAWWKRRAVAVPHFTYDNGVVTVAMRRNTSDHGAGAWPHEADQVAPESDMRARPEDAELTYRISFPEREEIITPIDGAFDTKGAKRTMAPASPAPFADIARARAFDPRHVLLTLLDHWYKIKQ